jgi:hypothetical protein
MDLNGNRVTGKCGEVIISYDDDRKREYVITCWRLELSCSVQM